jgi:primosomal protein N'
VSKIKGLYLKNILIKLEKTKHTSQLKEDVKELLDYFAKNAKHKSVRVIVDVDPY